MATPITYPDITTANISADPIAETSSEAISSSDFGTNVGELIEQQAGFHVGASSDDQTVDSRCNVGRTEQMIRLGAGAALLGAAAFVPLGRGWRIGLAALGASQLITGAMSYCPLWQALGINTRRDAAQ
jgi:hypothetical protein